MSHVTASDGVRLYYESQGGGAPIVFVHELAGSVRAFDLQVREGSARFRCIAFNARGYPPSDVPAALDSYSQDKAAGDIGAVLDGLQLESAHLVGVSMGSAASLQYALRQPKRVRSLTLTSIGSGSDMKPGEFAASLAATALLAETKGMQALAESYADLPNRSRLKEKNPAEAGKFITELASASLLGITNTMRGVQSRRPPIYAHEKAIAALTVPTLIVLGAEDAPCRGPSVFLNRIMGTARFEIFPATGHAVNLEDPEAYNRLVFDFIAGIEAGRGK
jgi:pimeloyl-ACP methyl ester carboxylesterase